MNHQSIKLFLLIIQNLFNFIIIENLRLYKKDYNNVTTLIQLYRAI